MGYINIINNNNGGAENTRRENTGHEIATYFSSAVMLGYIGLPQKMTPFLYALTLPNVDRFSKLFRC